MKPLETLVGVVALLGLVMLALVLLGFGAHVAVELVLWGWRNAF